MVTGIWEEFLTIAQQEVGSRIVETWFKAVTLQRWDGLNKIAYLQAPNQFVKDWIARNYLSVIQLHLGRLLHVQSPTITFVEARESHIHTSLVPAAVVTQAAVAVTDQKRAVISAPMQRSRGDINKSYTFDTFVVGPHNSLAHAAACAVTEKPGRLYNPLFIYGGSGLGKTHLLHSIGNEIRARDKKAVVLYQTTDRFVNEFINAIRFDKVVQFKEKYKSVDVLLIDDVQFISNKEQTQEAFFHIFNALYEEHKQIVFSSDTFPHDMHGLAERLRSRLSCGLVTDIYMPSLETKIAIVKKKAAFNNEHIDDDIALFIASKVVSNIRELEGAFIRVMAFASLTKQPLTLELAKKVLERLPEHASAAQTATADFERVVKYIGSYYACSLDDLRSKNRNKDLTMARQVAMFLMKKVTNKSLRDIGAYLGGRDHSTVMHAISKVELHATTHVEFSQQLTKLEQEIVR